MRLAHLSDLHLGFRAYSATERGWNLRERDVAAAFRAALRTLVGLKPDIVLVTGDVFDHPDPPSTAFLTFSRAVSRLRAHLPGVPILMIAGERDSPRNPADPGPVAVLDSVPGVEAASGAPRSVRFRSTGLHVLLVPFRAAARPPFPEVSADPLARWNVLLIRGDPTERGSGIRVEPDEWDYVAVGGDHAARSWGPNVWSAGSLERPLLSPWSEATEEKGFLTFDLAAREAEFHSVPGRPVVDLAPIRVAAGETDSGSRRLRELVQGVPGGIDGKIVRIRLRGDISLPSEGVSAGLLAAVRRKAAHLETHLQHPWTGESGTAPATWTPTALLVPAGAASAARLALEPATITLVTSSSEALRGDLVEALRRRGPEGEGAETVDDVSRLLWGGHRDPLELLRIVIQGLDEAGRDEAETSTPVPSPAEADQGSTAGGEDIRSMEARLSELRADSVEAAGDLEAAAMEWARERQDADSKLDFYRERARELRQQIQQLEIEGADAPCPTCGAPLGARLDELLDSLRGEWEGVVQDGSWWKRRREQLEDKPVEIRGMEEHALRLHMEVETAAEALELRRERERRAAPQGEDVGATGSMSRPPAVEGRALREILRAAGNLLGRITHGRIVGLRFVERGARVVTEDGRERLPTSTEAMALRLAVHLALWRHARARGFDVRALLIWELYGDGAEELAVAVLEVLSEVRRVGAAIVFIAPPSIQERAPEMFQEVAELGIDGEGQQELRRFRSGRCTLDLARAGSEAR